MTLLENYKLVLKRSRIHNRTTVGIKFIKNTVDKKLLLYTFAHDSIKLWNVVCSENEFEIFEEKVIDRSFCGIQSYDVSKNGEIIAVVGVESTLHRFKINNNFEVSTENYLGKFMEHWFVRISKDSNSIFTTSFSGSVKLLNIDGTQKISSLLDKIKLITAVEYSNTGLHIAVANTQGWITILDSKTLTSVCTFEAHSCKVRCVQFTINDTQILSGSDDKIIRLHTMKDSTATVDKNFCGHQGTIMAIVIDKSFGGERFASAALDNRIILWNTNSGEKLFVFKNDTTDFPRSIAFSPNGRFLATITDESFLFVYTIPQSENYIEEEKDDHETSENLYALDSPINGHNNKEMLYSANKNMTERVSPIKDNLKLQFTTDETFETNFDINDSLKNDEDFSIKNTEIAETFESSEKKNEITEINQDTEKLMTENGKNIKHDLDETFEQENQKEENSSEDVERREIEMQLGID